MKEKPMHLSEKEILKLINKNAVVGTDCDPSLHNPILNVTDLKTHFPIYGGVFRHVTGYVNALNGVSFSLNKGETLGIVGESGCGKSTLGKTIIKLNDAYYGSVEFTFKNSNDRNYTVDFVKLNPREMRDFRGKIQMIFQDPYSSLNPRLTVEEIISEPIEVHQGKMKNRRDVVYHLLKKVGLSEEHATRYPHEFSGGQRQRIGIARALSTSPDIIIADEPVSALDVSVQAQVINVMKDLQDELGLSYLFIAHDISVVRHISHRIAVMYLGHIVEIGEADEIYTNPRHPYTKALISAVPLVSRGQKKKRILLTGDIPSSDTVPSGCVFHTRCYMADAVCREKVPAAKKLDSGVICRCHFV
jgi:oligopeptide transport system ATP-binding protein